MDELSTSNSRWKSRLIGNETVTAQDAIGWGFSGVMLRGSRPILDNESSMRRDISWRITRIYTERTSTRFMKRSEDFIATFTKEMLAPYKTY